MDARAHGQLLVDTLHLGDAGDDDHAALASGWSRVDQDVLVAQAVREGAELWLHRRLRAAQVVLAVGPRDALEVAARHVRARTMRADAALARVAAIFATADVAMVPLKSAALRRLTSRLPLADARASADVDVLVPEHEADRATIVLRGKHFSPVVATGAVPEGHHHRAPLADDTGVAVEVHATTHPAVRPAEAWRRATRDAQGAAIDGVPLQLPCDTELLWHALAHAHLDASDHARIGLRLRYWLDGAVLIAGGTIDWATIRSRLDGGELRPPELARAWLWWAAALAGRTLGFAELGASEVGALDLPRLLAWRLHVHADHPADSRWREKLLEEGARAEAGLPRRGKEAGNSPATAARRAAAALAARAAYSAWRAGLATSDDFTGEYPAPVSPPA